MTRAFRIEEFVNRQTLFGRTKVYALIRDGVIPVREIGGVRVILEEEWNATLHAAPLVAPRTADATLT